ncbi:MAG: PilZ domain-containing protein [Phycisphaerales bacterium]|nr:PilZ domain-containing protein [Phycisphaerales bacterium]
MKTVDNEQVRQHSRRSCCLAAVVAPAAAEGQVQLTKQAMENAAEHTLVVDFSEGGLGLRGPVMFPRGCQLEVRLSGLDETAEGEMKSLTMRVRVQRVQMRAGNVYYMGTSFDNAKDSPTHVAALRSLTDRAAGGADV